MKSPLCQLACTSALVAASLALTACATLNDVVTVKEMKKEGTSRSYAVAPDKAYEIARTVFRWEGADAIEDHRAEGYMLTSSGNQYYTRGAVMGAWVEPEGEGGTRVTVVTKRRVTVDIFTSLTESTFHKRFGQALELVRQGKPLPDRAPA